MRDPNYREKQGQERGSRQQGNKCSHQEMNRGDSSREGSHNRSESLNASRQAVVGRPEFLLSLE